ncbi:MAG: hypothetical protein ABIL15_06650 [candidate division WOR-3 bacterium]
MDTYPKFALITLSILLPIFGFAQTERWVYRYSGTTIYRWDEAYCLVYGADGNIYAGGYTYNDSTNKDFTVISLTNSGSERWVYKYLTFGNMPDECYSICYGNDGNIYAAGDCTGSDSVMHFTIISLTPEGTERWVYQYSNTSGAQGVCYGADGNIYGVGSTQGKILVVSVDTSGAERWHYIYPTPSAETYPGRSITYGFDGNIYVTGHSGPVLNTDVTAISLTPTGSERWVYLYNGPGNSYDYGNWIIYAQDNNLYIFGITCYYYSPYVFTIGLVISLTNSGNERWAYISSTLGGFWCGICGIDGNLYAAGFHGSDIQFFFVESVSDTGAYRWQFIDTTCGWARSIAGGNDGNIYAGGITSDNWQDGENYFTVISFTASGSQRWIYQKSQPGNLWDEAISVVCGTDGNIYAGGILSDSATKEDFAVISLTSTGIEESKKLKVEGERLNLMVSPSVVKDNAQIQFTIPERQRIIMNLYDIIGRKIKTIKEGIVDAGVYSYRLDSSSLSSGVYYIILQGERESKRGKILVVK